MKVDDGSSTREDPYQHLRTLARWMLSRRHRTSHLQTTSLAHETWIKAARSHRGPGLLPFGTVVTIMRSVIVDEARRERALKRGGSWRRVVLDEREGVGRRVDVLELDEALTALERTHPRSAQVLELRLFGGLGTSQTAALLRLGERTVESELRFAKAMLRVSLDPG